MAYDPMFEHKANHHWNNGYCVAMGKLKETRVKPLAYEENHMVQYLAGYNTAKRKQLTKLLEGKTNAS